MDNTGASGKILLIDDDQDILDVYQEFLTAEGFSVEVARDGEEGLAKLHQGGYDLILLDIMMPKVDGLGVLRGLKANPNQGDVYNGPIVVLSALDQPKIIEEAMNLGAKGYIVKTNMTPDKTLEKIYQFMNS